MFLSDAFSQCAVNAGNDITICSGQSVTLGGNPVLGNGFGNNPDFEWSNGETNDQTPTVSPNSTTTYTLEVENSGVCLAGNYSDQVTVTVISAALAGAQLTTFNGSNYFVQCTSAGANGLIFISNAVDPAFASLVSNYTINWGDGSANFTTTTDAWTPQNHEYAPGIYTLTYTITGPNNCTTSRNYQVFVGNSPAVGLGSPGNTEGCTPITLTFPILNTNNNVPGTIYNVVFSDGSPTVTLNHPAPANITHTFQQSSCGQSVTNGSVVEQNAYGVTIQAVNPCGSSSATVAPIRLSEPPSASLTANPETVCINQTSTITSTSDLGSYVTGTTCNSNAVLYWTVTPAAGWSTTGTLGSSNGFAPVNFAGWTPGSNSLPLTFSAVGTYTITQHIANGCGEDTFTETVCVIPPPTCAFTINPTSGCSVLNVTSSNTSQPPSCNGVPLALQYTWTVSPPSGGTGTSTISSTSAQNPTFSFTNTGTTNITFTITLTVAPVNPQTGLPMTCTTTCTQQVTVFPSPVIASPPAPQVNCGPFNPSSFSLSFTGGPANPQFQWYSTTNPTNPGGPGNLGTAISGATNSSYDPPNTINVSTYYFCTITYTGVPNCSSYQSGLFQAIVNPAPTVAAGNDQTICSTSSANLTAIGNGGSGTLSYSWSPTTGLSNASISNPVANPTATTTYNVSVTDANGCTATDAVVVTVNTAVTADITGTYSFCGAQTFTLSGTAVGSGQWTNNTAGTFSNPTSITSSYTPAASQVGTTFNLTWTTTDPDGTGPTGPCPAATDQVSVTITSPGTFTPTTPITICSGSTASLSVTTTPATGSWSGGGGSFANANAASTVYTPGGNDVGNANLILVWTTTDPDGIGPCSPLTVNQPLSVIGTATANAGGPYAICGAAAVTLSGSANGNGQWTGGAGTFSNATLVNSTYTPASGEIGTTINLTWTTNDPDGAGPCNSANDQATVTVSTPATFTPLTPITICSSSTASLSVTTTPATGSWSGGSGTFAPANAANTVYTPGANDVSNASLTLVWTTSDPDGAGPCPSITVDQPLDVIGTATAEAAGPYAICGSSAITLGATANGAGQWTGGAGTFSNATLVNSTYTPAAGEVGTTVNLTWTTNDPDGAGPCNSANDQATVTVSTPATFTPLTPITICSSSTASLSVTTTPATGSWSGGSGAFAPANAANTVYTPGANDVSNASLTLVWTTSDPDGAGPCPSITVDQPLDVIGTATAEAAGPYAICGSTAITLGATANGAGQWTGGAGTFSNATLVNSTYTPAAGEVGTTVNLTWTTNDPDGAGPCNSATDQATVNVSTPATFTPLTPITICSSSTASLSVTTTPATGSWSGGSGTFANASSATTIYTPGPNDVTTANLTLVWTTSDPDGSGPCPSISVDQPLDVIGTATAEAGGPYAICGASAIMLNASSNGNGQWTGGLGTYSDDTQLNTTYTPAASEVGGSITLTWTTNDPDGAGPCLDADDDATLNISTPAVLNPLTSLAICSNSVAQLSATSTPSSGTWSTPDGTGTFANATSPQTTYTPGLNETGSIEIRWTTSDPDNSGPCPSISEPLTLDILQTAIAEITTTYSVCANGTLNIDVQENGTGEWTVEPLAAGTFADSSLSSTQFIPSVDYYTAQNLEIKWTTFDPDAGGPCTFDADSTLVGILPLPQINMAPSFTIPCGDDISATVNTYQNVSYTFTWTPQAGLITPGQLVTPAVGDDDYALQVTDANGCINADTTTVDAIALANMASASNASTCLYVPIELSGVAADGQGPFTYNWVVTEEVTPSALDNTLANFVFDDYILQDTILNIEFEVSDLYGCTDDTVISVTVFALPAIDPGQNWNLCEDSPVFTLTAFSPQSNTGISGVWTPSDVVDPDQIGVNAITYTYTFTDNNGCVNDSSMVVSINEVPEPIVVVPSVACVDTPLPLENLTTCATCASVSFEWDFGIANSTSTEFEPSFVYSVNDIGLQTVQLVAVSGFGCDDTTQAIVDIVLPPVPLFEATYNQPSCAPLAVDISHNTDTTGLYLSYEWTIEDVTESNIVGVYTTFLPPPIVLQQGDSIVDYTITLMVSNVCGNYDTDTIVSVLPQPVADILTSTVYGCTPLVVDFINESVGLPDAIEWDFGDGTFSGMDTPPPHTFYTDSTITIYNLAVALENECGVDTFFQDITVLPNTVNALFATSTAAGCTPLEVTFTDFSTGASQLNFTLCNGATFSGETFTYTFTDPGDCVVELVADNGCSYDTTSVSIFVVQSPEPVIVAEDSYCANETIEFSASNAQNAMLTWNFDDGSLPTAGNPIEHEYTDAGDYIVELHAENDLFGVVCEGTATLPVHISPNPEANFAIPTSYGCSPFQLCFENLSGTSDPNMLLSYQWNFDGINGDTDFAPCYTYYNQSGELVYYTVTLEVTASDIQYMQTCTSETSQNILVQPQPISGFDMESDYTCYYPFQLNALNTTVGGGSYQWQFNGNDWGQLTNGTFLIDNLGAYAIDLIAMNQFGCTDTASQVFNSYPLPELDFTFDLNDGCAPLMVQFENLSTGNNTYVWNMDDGTEANIQDIIHQFNFPGSYDVMLIGTSENNCTDTVTIDDPILVYPVPVADFIFAPEEVNILDPQMTFEETSFGASYYQWDFNDGSEDYGAIVTHSFSEAYYHAVTLTAYNQYGCSDDITKNVFVTDYLTVYVPSAFTPDDDNINDIFRPEMGGKELITRYKFWITDRWGNVIFETNDYDTPWTGNVRDGEHYVSPDIYIWNVEAELKNGEEREYNGHVTVVR